MSARTDAPPRPGAADVLDALTCGVLAWNDQDAIIHVNEAAENLLGLRAGQLRRLTRAELAQRVHPVREDGTPLLPPEFPSAAAVRTRQPVRDVTVGITRSDGPRRWFQVDVVPICSADGTLDLVVSTFVDISACKHADEAVRRSAQLQEALVSLTLLVNATLDLDAMLQRICLVPRAVVGEVSVLIFVLDPPATLRLAATSVPGVPTGMRVPLASRGAAAARAARERRAFIVAPFPPHPPYEIRRIQHHLPPVAAVLAAPIMVGDDLSGVLVFASSQVRHFAEADLASAMQMGRVIGIALRNADLYQRERALADRLRQIERWRCGFLRVMAHELRTPLGQILGFTDLASAEATQLSARGQRYLANVQTAAARLEALVDRSFDLMRLSTADMTLSRTAVDLVQLVTAALPPFHARAVAKSITLHATLPAQPVLLQADTQRLQQALAVLLDNAVTFTAAGGAITVGIHRGVATAKITVGDNGPGVPADMREYIFGAGQAEDALTRRHRGTGLSLVLARRIAELHGGALSLDPTAPGALFVLSLPLDGARGQVPAGPAL